ncbi:succinate dehydrogenase [Thiocapsa imhoffii]|uniref:Succinate dehydrogenase n=1 Tax=Thiocapsa imhoffii TaxID=382777 RepID=A0A9X1B946_9GAMM|nr:succinate dehydrogenase [Thiocapsa imhoffii]MBK1645589.1 succinate dehydrogenase [Thiocapsa imhoffii]
MSTSIDNPHFLLRRVHSLLGLIPVGAFLIFHLWENSQSRLGAEHYNEQVVAALKGMNYLPLLEIFVIALPLLFHAGYGLVISAQMRSELLRYRYPRNHLYWMQRISGIGILFFLLLHVGMTRIQGFWDPAVAEDLYTHMQALLSQPWLLGVYVVGLLLSVFHFANGLSSMAIAWGVTTSVRAQRLFGGFCVLFGLLLAALGLHGLMGFLR